jgi:long-chain fatty acid transport protein
MFRRLIGSLLAGTALAAVAATAAQAGAFGTRQHSVVGAGQSYAGVAAPGIGLSGMFWNPAVVTSVGGRNSEWNLFGILPNTTLNNLSYTATGGPPGASAAALAAMNAAGGPGEIGTSLLSTASYTNWQIAPNVFLGLSINAPYGSGTNAQRTWGGSWDVLRTRISSVNVQPVIGYRINEQLSIAIGAQLQWINITQEQSIGPIGPFGGTAGAVGRVTGNDEGVGFTAGLTWTPFAGTAIGIGYRSAVHHRVEGTQSFNATVVNPLTGGIAIPSGTSVPVTADFSTPDQITASLRQQITDRLAVSATVEWVNWSRVGVVPIVGSPVGSSLVLNYRDGWYAALGFDYRVVDNLTVRAGIGYEWTPVTDAFRTLSIPDADRLWLSAGFTYDVNDRLSVSGSYTFIQLDEGQLNRTRSFVLAPPPVTPLTVTYAGQTESTIHIFGISARYRWDDPLIAESAVIARN